jgi:pyridoxine 5'-phosphate synthase PdxJ
MRFLLILLVSLSLYGCGPWVHLDNVRNAETVDEFTEKLIAEIGKKNVTKIGSDTSLYKIRDYQMYEVEKELERACKRRGSAYKEYFHLNGEALRIAKERVSPDIEKLAGPYFKNKKILSDFSFLSFSSSASSLFDKACVVHERGQPDKYYSWEVIGVFPDKPNSTTNDLRLAITGNEYLSEKIGELIDNEDPNLMLFNAVIESDIEMAREAFSKGVTLFDNNYAKIRNNLYIETSDYLFSNPIIIAAKKKDPEMANLLMEKYEEIPLDDRLELSYDNCFRFIKYSLAREPEVRNIFLSFDSVRDETIRAVKEVEGHDAFVANIEKRAKNHMKTIGAKICRTEIDSYSIRYIGFIERVSGDKIQIRVSGAHLLHSPSLRPSGFQPTIIWDYPENWEPCE